MDTSHNYTGSDSRLASYVPQQQKPEWKRYKQYTRTDILSAIDCVRNGMSALQASRKYGVPSRTLYDKVKKLGITTARPMNRTIKRSPSNGGSPAGFPYGISGTSSPYGHHDNHNQSHVHSQSQSMQNDSSERDSDRSGEQHQLPPSISHPAAALLDAALLQQALEARGGDIAGRELHAMALAAAAHAAVNGMSTSPGTHGTARSPSPSILLKYMRPTSPRPPSLQSVDHSIDHDRERISMERERDRDHDHRDRENNHHSHHHLSHHPPPPPLPPSSSSSSHLQQSLSVAEEDRVEDLSMGKKNLDLFLPLTSHGVIVPPMQTKLQSSHNIDSVLLNVKREQISDDDPHN